MNRSEEIALVSQSIIPTLLVGDVTAERIRNVVQSPLLEAITRINNFEPLTEDEKIALQNELAFQFLHIRDLNTIVFSEPFEPWLARFKATAKFDFWNDYKHYLYTVKHFDADTINSIDSTTDKVLDLCGDPSKSALGPRKGLVVGNVQSGKTADYIGLITKAADSGYKVIVVLAGLQNALRSQTQGRIDEGFVGVSKVELDENGGRSIVDSVVGVGLSAQPRPFSVLSLTTLQSDFTCKTAQSVTATHGLDDNSVYIAVAKKNLTTLKSLIRWFSSAICNRPMLLIDDEADNASVNYCEEDAPTTINRLIRDLLGKFPRSTYVGYTATPFANIFIDPDVMTVDHGEDLFPRDFVVALDVSPYYFGPSRIFGSLARDDDKFICEITDNNKYLPIDHKKDVLVRGLPPSLKEALCAYVLATAIRISRGDVNCHSSALVNVSRFIDVHETVARLIRAEIDRLKNAIRVYGKLPYGRNAVMTELHDIYNQMYRDCGIGWGELQTNLEAAVSPVEVLEIHMKGDSRKLNYSRDNFPHGRKVIAVGGFSLSRGLTLEGLCISYVLRNSKMYDTLMQMGRWFGYRHGYEDLCRIYLCRNAIDWYRHITEAMEELWGEFAEMARDNLTPSQFGLRVRAHPLHLIVTARNKMKAAREVTVQIDLSGRHVEPNCFNINDLAWNKRVAEEFLLDIGKPNGDVAPCDGYYWTNVSYRRIQAFVRDSKRLDVNMDTATTPLCNYLEKWASKGDGACDVYLVSTAERPDYSIGGLDICREAFAVDIEDNGMITVGGGRKHVTGKNQERAGLARVLDTDEVQRLLELHRDAATGRVNVSGRFFRKFRTRPLLVLHVVKGMQSEDAPRAVVDCSEIIVWRLIFPGDAQSYHPDRLVTYVLNPVAVRQHFSDDQDDLEEEE